MEVNMLKPPEKDLHEEIKNQAPSPSMDIHLYLLDPKIPEDAYIDLKAIVTIRQ